MDYTELTGEQLGACHRTLCVLTGQVLNAKAMCEFEGLGGMGYLAAWQEFLNLIGAMEADLVEAWGVTGQQEAPSS